MRIAYLINQYPKVSHSFIRREILALERLGVEVMRISLRGWDIELVDPEDLRERARTKYVLRDGILALLFSFLRVLVRRPLRVLQALRLTFVMGWKGERPLPYHLAYLAEACRIVTWLENEHVQHLHAHFGTNSAEVAMLVNVLGGPQWSFTVHGPKEFEKVEAIGLGEKIRRSAFVVAISSYGKSQLYRLVQHQHWGKVQTVHCGMEPDFAAMTVAPLHPVRRLVCVGRLCEQKGHFLLLEATRRLIRSGEDFELVLAGDGEMRRDIESLITHNRLEDNVRITGWISSKQVRQELLAARALVLPSFAEGLPVAIMEAMALQRPVISTYIAGIPELVVPGKHGWLVPAGDIDTLVEAMRACLNEKPDELSRMGAAGQLRVNRRHNVDTEAEKLLSLFQLAIDGKRTAYPPS